MWKEPKGQLTDVGLKADFEYGKVLKRKYLDSGLVASNAIDARESALTVYASSSDRALQSAQALLRGMFGVRESLQTVPVHGAVSAMLDGWERWPSAADMDASVRHDKVWAARKKEKLYLATKKKLADELGVKVTLEEWQTLYDWIQSAQHSGVGEEALPEKLTTQLARDVLEIGEWRLTLPFVHRNGAALGPLTGGVILHDVLQKVAAVQAKESKATKMVIYSAHAANIMGLLQLLGLDKALRRPPSFGDALLIEVAQPSGGGPEVVLVRYGGEVWPLPQCPDAGECTYASFAAMYQRYANQSFVSLTWPSICDRDALASCPPLTFHPTSFISFIPLWVVAGVLAGLLAAILMLLVAWKWYRNRTYRKRSEIMLDLEIE